MSNCRSLDGSSQLQCFVRGLDVVQDCADTRNYPTELAPAMLAAGRGTDGQEGSLCTAVLVGAGAPSSKCALLFPLCIACFMKESAALSPAMRCRLRLSGLQQAAAVSPRLHCKLTLPESFPVT